MRHYPELDGLRGFWAFLVLLVHVQARGFLNLFFFMDGFFALSAFVIAGALLRRAGGSPASRLGDFFRRRAARILPGYYLTTVAAVAAGVLVNRLRTHGNLPPIFDTTNIRDYFLFIQFIPRYWQDTTAYAVFAPLDHTWSLAIEEQFYLVCGTAWILFTARSARWIISIACIAIGVASRVSSVDGALALYHLDALGYGLAGALLFERAAHDALRRASLYRMTASICLAAFAVYGVMLLVIGAPIEEYDGERRWVWMPATVLSSLGSSTLVLWVALGSGSRLFSVMKTPPMLYLGRISYALYLCHYVITSVGLRTGVFRWPATDAQQVLNGLLVVCVSIAVAHLMTTRMDRWQDRINA